ncbi:MAG: hypothetical protein V4599_03185 [Verrucomicrobiota bacterium]
MAAQPFFSIKAAIKVSALHFGLTYVFALLAFFTAMGSFTKNVTDEMIFWNMVMWVWTPLARATFKSGSDNWESVHLLALGWSVIMGLMAGWFRKYFCEPSPLDWNE